MRKMVLFISLVLSLLSLNGFAWKFKLNPYCNPSSKDFELLTLGLGSEFFFLESTGFYVEYTYIYTNAGFESPTSYSKPPLPKAPLSYKGLHLSVGGKLEFTLMRNPLVSELIVYAKGGMRYIREYATILESRYSGNGSSSTAGGGLMFWRKRIGVSIEVMKNFSPSTKGLREDVFKGLWVYLKGVLRL